MINVTCSLQEKNSIYQAVLSYKEDNKWKTKWVSTKIKATRKNKREAELKLENIKNDFYSELNKNYSINNDSYMTEIISENANISTINNQYVEMKEEKILFIDFMKDWLEMIKPSIEEVTYCSYAKIVNVKMKAYFEDKNITLEKLKPIDIQKFYQYLIDSGLTGNTVRHYHANIRKALQYAVKTELISVNPADRIELPKMEKYTAQYYTKDELLSIFKIIKGTKLETAVMLAGFYGLRRSEIVGLKWSAINFENKTITINHVINQISDNCHTKIIKKNRTKTISSTRTLPLIPVIESYLLELQEKQKQNKKKFGNEYNLEFLDYICVTNKGELIHPNYITQTFRKILIANNLKLHRFHDLRHSVASLLLNEGISMKQIQIWLGHSNYNTTANIYAHLDSNRMNESAEIIANVLSPTKNVKLN